MAMLLPFCAVLLTGCETSLTVSELKNGPSSTNINAVPAGFIYNLPAAVIRPTAYVTIRDCAVDTELEKVLAQIEPKGVKPVTEIKFVVGGSLSATQVAHQTILIDYRELQQFLKTSSISLERHPNGMLKSINASMADQTPQAIAAVASALGSAALFATGAPGAVLGAAGGLSDRSLMEIASADDKKDAKKDAPRKITERISFAACTPATYSLVTDRKAAAAKRNELISLLDNVTAEAAKLGADPKADSAKLDSLKVQKEKYSVQLDKVTAELSDIDAQLTLPLGSSKIYSEIKYPTPNNDSQQTIPANHSVIQSNNKTDMAFNSGQINPELLAGGIVLFSPNPGSFLARHFIDGHGNHTRLRAEPSLSNRPCRSQLNETCSSKSAIENVFTKISEVKIKERDMKPKYPGESALSIPAVSSDSNCTSSDATCESEVPKNHINANEGIIYVEPAKLKVDMTTANIGPQSVLSQDRVIHTADISVPQLGRYLALPLSAGFGEKSELKATFAEDGSLLTGTFAQPEESGLEFANALKGLADTALNTRTGIEDRKLKLLKQRADALSLAAGIQETTNKLTPTTDPMDDLNAELARVTAAASIAEAELRLQTARAKLLTP
ncbi:hypothetical protein CHU95_05380 [Niveispirillum lacus]|uniref:Uncharacterized protein n=2 Tax=Niveispirillum lacus TaxID=1981099 RepID=A0A255Z469_9PROT|nr:hypothetical protein CHU95_05380 [Niveispirillum lacus]